MVRLGRFYSLGLGLASISLAVPALAHNVKISGEVAATFHIEPHHNPRAGQPSQAWFALTERGGKVIPLAQCNCRLKVYPTPHPEGVAPLLEPVLKPLSTEQYQGIPSADITFPKVGAYALEISGTPKAEATFQPFELSYEVTVASGASASNTSPRPSAQPVDPKAALLPKAAGPTASATEAWPKVAGAGLGAMVIATLGYGLWRKNIRRTP